MFIDLPLQTDDLEAQASRFDNHTTPPNVTMPEDATVDVAFRAAETPQRYQSSNPRVATADSIPGALFRNLGSQDWPVQVSGHSPGVAVISAIDAKGKAI